MWGEHRYSVRTTWTGDRGTGTSGYRDYDRATTIEIDGKPALLASSDKPFRGDPSRWNPEDMLLASLSECHLLSYLHACVQAGVVVVGYEDEASGLMVEDGRGRVDDGCGGRRACAGERVVLHRELGELPGAPRAHDPGRCRRSLSELH